jgi:hypothetical protein
LCYAFPPTLQDLINISSVAPQTEKITQGSSAIFQLRCQSPSIAMKKYSSQYKPRKNQSPQTQIKMHQTKRHSAYRTSKKITPSYPQEKDMKKIVYIISFITTATLLNKFVFPTKPSPQDTEKEIIEAFKKASDDLNSHGSRMIDDQTRLDKTEIGPGATMTYFYTLIQHASKDGDINSLRKRIDEMLWEGVCKNEAMRKATMLGGKYVYVFSSSDRIELQRFEYGKNECLQARAIKVQK